MNFLNDDPINIFYIISQKYFIKYFIIATAIVAVTEFILIPIYYRRCYKSDKMVDAERNFYITDEFISMSTDFTSLKITKEKIKKVIFNRDSIYIFTSLSSVLIFKRHYLNSDKEFEELKIFINEKYNIKK
jgi:hypothetical protein